MKNNKLLAVAFGVLLTCFTAKAQYTAIPDPKFEEVLDPTNIDGKVLTANIVNITSLNIEVKQISNLTGIQDFLALKSLHCYGNQLTALDVSKNTALTDLWCFGNQLTTLDVSKNTALTFLDCSSNKLTTLDVSKNTALKGLSCSSNQLTTLDASQNTALTSLYCDSNKLISLDVSQNTALKYLDCTLNKLLVLDVTKSTGLKTLHFNTNSLTTLDVSQNTALTELNCGNNKLLVLDVSKNTLLTTLYCNSNQLTTLDVSKNTALTKFVCSGNKLQNLNIKNGNNSKLSTFNCTNNPNLTCIQADSNYLLNSKFWYKDATASYTDTDCSNLANPIFEKNEISVLIYPNPADDIVNIMLPTDVELKKVEVYSTTGQKVETTTTQSFVSLKDLPKGEYLLVIETSAGRLTQKLIKK